MESGLSISTAPQSKLPTSLLQLLSNTLVLYQTVPYLPVSSVLALGSTSKSFHALIHRTPHVFRRLDLSQVKYARSEIGSLDHGGEVWRNIQVDENVTEDDFYGGPLRGIFSNLRRRNILQDVRTLVLDGLTVPADLVTEIITHESFNVQVLSIRDVQHLNERKLQQALLYAVRPSRPAGTPKLQGLYIFGPKDPPSSSRPRPHIKRYPPGVAPLDIVPSYGGSISARGAQIGARWNQKSEDALAEDMASDKWFQKSGKVFPKVPSSEWAETIQACQGIICFDAVLCNGPRHSALIKYTSFEKPNSSPWYWRPDAYIPPRIATHGLGVCSRCGGAPESVARFEISPMERFPLLAPPPLHSSTIKSAKTPLRRDSHHTKELLVRCVECLRNRYCESCHKWWCEDCYEVGNPGYTSAATESLHSVSAGQEELNRDVKLGVIRGCFGCGLNCARCIDRTQRMCSLCTGGYCLIHNEGSTPITCDWCTKSGRRTREMY